MAFLKYAQLITFDSASLTGSYQTILAAGFARPTRVLKFFNDSTVTITVSYNGTDDQDIFPASSVQIIDVQTNHDTTGSFGSGEEKVAEKQQIYVKGSAGTGNFYVVGYP